MEPSESPRIVRFADGRELPVEAASSGRYVFAAYTASDPDTLFAFDLDEAEEQRQQFAADRGLEQDLAHAREVIASLPEDPSSEVDPKAERAEVAEIDKRVTQFASEPNTPAIGAPDFLQTAHEKGVLDSAILY